MSKKKKAGGDHPPSETKVLFPGRRIALASDPDDPDDPLAGVFAEVFPLGVCHIDRFANEITGALMLLASDMARLRGKGGEDAQLGGAVLQQLVPFVIRNLMSLFRACVKIGDTRLSDVDEEVTNLPHWVAPKLIEAWIADSFGEEEKWRPWVTATENVLAQFGVETSSISGIFSKLSSPQDTTSGGSSTKDSPGSPSGGGPSPN